jgi:hypothetical protein
MADAFEQSFVNLQLPGSVRDATNIHTAILIASVNFGSFEKDADNPYYKSRYLSLGALLQAVRPALTNEGVIITSRYKLVPQGWVVETELLHLPSNTSISSQFPVVDCTMPQKVGAAGTFAMRYNLLQLLAIAATDDDGNSASGLTPPGEFLGPVPNGQQRNNPQAMPTPGAYPGPDWL